MQGLGRDAGPNTLFYGSVHDGTTSRSLETKLKKAYWETKQSLIQKLGKDQDEHVVASDSDIDVRLEQSRRLEASCHGLSFCIKRYNATVSELVTKHYNLGYYLDNSSQKEVTSVARVMKDVGNIEKSTAGSWQKVSPALRQLSHDLDVFITRGLKDLSDSTKGLEKARTEHRAALLWFKKESAKLSNPDNSEQLANFRMAQVRVKETRERFEQLKSDMAEKIEMVVVSRCNMLSKSLPTYQNGLLTFFEDSSKELHKLLLEIKAHHHPQYKRSSDIVEEQDLMRDKEQFEKLDGATECNLPAAEMQPVTQDDDLLLDFGTTPTLDSTQEPSKEPTGTTATSSQDTENETSAEQSLESEDNLLSLLSWNELSDKKEKSPIPPTTTGAMSTSQDVNSIDELKELLKIDPILMPSPSDIPADKQEDSGGDGQSWDDISAFLSGDKKNESRTEASDWQSELQSLLGGDVPSQPVEDPLADFLGDIPAVDSTQQSQPLPLSTDGDLLLQDTTPDLLQNDPSRQPGPSPSTDLMSLDSSISQPTGLPFSQPTSLPFLQPTGLPFSQPTGLPLAVGGTPVMQPMIPSMPSPSQQFPGGPVLQPQPSIPPHSLPHPKSSPNSVQKQSSTDSSQKAEPGNMYEAWTKIFSQLNPLANDKV